MVCPLFNTKRHFKNANKLVQLDFKKDRMSFDKGERMKRLHYLLTVLILASFLIGNFSISKALTSSLVEVTGFGTNPSNLRMFVYIPTTAKPNPPILVAVHWCGGSADAMYGGTQYAALADQYGYIIVYPSTTNFGSCFDVSSPAALSRNGGSDPVGIMSMVTYAAQHYNGNLDQVYVTGISSGAMMTNVLLGDYPDVFKAGAAFAGVPFACMATTDGTVWNATCPPGQMIKTPQEWGDLVRAAYPGYNGPRPRMQLWHGTEDTGLAYPNFGEEIKQWTNVHGVSQTPVSTDSPATGQTRTRYGTSTSAVVVEAISLQGVGHSLPVDALAAIHFFGLDGSVTPTPSITPGGPTFTPSRTPTKTLTPTITNTPAPGLQVKIQGAGTDTNSQTSMNLQIVNTGSTSLNNITWRLYFTPENGNAASSYVVEKYYDQTSAATISGPTLACGSIYYYTVSYGTTSLPTSGVWAFNTAFHLSSFASTYDSSNDWWRGSYVAGTLPPIFSNHTYIPGYVNGTLLWGNEPTCSGATNTPVVTATRTNTAVVTNTATATPTRSLTPAISSTPTRTATRTNTPAVSNTPTRTATRTNTPAITSTPTRTFTPGVVTSTPSRTAAPVTATPTTSSSTCSPVTSTITAPFTFDGAGTFCWQSSNLGGYINSWNTTSVSVNGTNYTNLYAAVGSLPAKVGGYWYVSYNSAVAWGHFETK